jgi:hypothetical protein
MLGYLYPLLAIIVLCALWAAFQLWLNKVDPDNQTNVTYRDQLEGTCGGCEEPCGKEALFRQ